MEFTARQIASLLNGTLEGDPDARVDRLAKIEEGTPGSLCFLANPSYNPFLYTTSASVVIVNRDFTPSHPVAATLIRVDDAYSSFATLLQAYQNLQKKSGISERAYVSPKAVISEGAWIAEFAYISDGAKIGRNVQVYPQVYIGDNVILGDDTVLYPGVKIYNDCVIGRECTIHGGAVIGSDGFGFAPQQGDVYKKIPQVGNVIVEDYVEIGSNTTIDRATLGSTVIRKGVKLDNLIQVAHNVEIGENTVIAAQTGISGSTHIGRNCMIGGQVGFVGHITIADNVKIGARSGVEGHVKEEGAVIFGAPAIEASKARRAYIHWRNFDEIVKRINGLEKQLKQLIQKHE
jgi:UDP-3-O-[3-hydroxymyristoyl] glucosamine N-acyltransferase